MRNAPHLSKRGSQPKPAYLIKVSPERKASEIKRLREWAARNIRGGARHG